VKPPISLVDYPAAIDLSGKPKVVMAIGLGGAGKTTLMRWIGERSVERGSTVSLVAGDPENRELVDYFDGVLQPESFEAAAITSWMERFLTFAMNNKRSALIDFGGGDQSLASIVAEMPDLATMMTNAGTPAVALYVVSPRIADLSPLATMEAAGFQPDATAIVLNTGIGDPTVPAEERFARTLNHPTFKAAVERGALPIWMPRLHAAKAVEDRRIPFGTARDGKMPSGRKGAPLSMFDQSRVRHWLQQMEEAFAPVASWLP
jgi:hypothetical protein